MTLEEAREKGYHFLDPSRFKAIETNQYLVKRKGDMGLISAEFFQSMNQATNFIKTQVEAEADVWTNDIYYELLGPDGEHINYHIAWSATIVVRN